MKYIQLIIIGISLFLSAFAQNTKPMVSIQNVSVDEATKNVSISYQLIDAENDNCDIWLKISKDGGAFFENIPGTELTGDAGSGIAPGASKTIIWDYAAHIGNIYDTRLKLYASDNQPVSIADMVSAVDSNILKGNLQFIEGIRHYTAGLPHLDAVRDTLEKSFIHYGLDFEKHNFTYNTYPGVNILGRKAGAKDESITFIIDAHYDGVADSPAADDNGSAVAGMLEVLRILSEYDFEHSIRFIGFDFEELGLIGSQRYVQNGVMGYEDIQGVLNLEMIGYYSDEPNSQTIPPGFDLLFPDAVQQINADDKRGNFLVVCGNTNSNSLITAYVNAASTYVPELKTVKLEVPGNGQIAPDLRRSDHTSFWETGRKALLLTDGADTRNHNYHTAADTIGNLNFEFMSNIVKATIATAAELAVPVSMGYDEFNMAPLSILDHDHSHTFPASIELYPNPANGRVFLKIAAEKYFRAKIEIYDLSGKVVWNKVSEFEKGAGLMELDLSKLSSGNYILTITSGELAVSRSLFLGN